MSSKSALTGLRIGIIGAGNMGQWERPPRSNGLTPNGLKHRLRIGRKTMHIRPVTRVDVAPAQSIETILDIINQIFATLLSFETLFGIDFSALFGKTS